MKKTRDYAATKSFIHLLHRASQCADEKFVRATGGLGVTARQLVVLSIVAEHNDPSQTLICDKSGIDRSTMADIVARLAERGLLSRQRTRLDGRKYAVRLTLAGRKCLGEAIRAAKQVDMALTRPLSTQQRRAFGIWVCRIVDNCKAG